jgi:hypothetical protein
MTEIAVLPQKVVDTKTSVLKSRLDSRMARNLGEQLKRRFFRNFGFLKPAAEDVQLVGFEKYYEPYLVIGGIYSIDYCRQHICKVKVGENTGEIFVGGKKFRSEPSSERDQPTRFVRLEGEEIVHYEKETYFILDRFRREVSPENFSLAPYENQVDNPKYVDMSFRKCDSSTEADIEFLSAKIAHRPKDAAEVMREIFEIRERTIIYRPVYELTFQDLKTAKEATLQIDGVSGKMALMRYRQKDKRKLPEPPASFRPDFSASQLPSRQSEPKLKPLNKSPEEKKEVEQQSPIIDSGQLSRESFPQKEEVPDFPADIKAEVYTVGDNVTAVIGDLEIPSGTNINELLVVKGTLKIGDRCHLSKKLKALGDIVIGSETVIEDNLVSGGNVVIGAGTVIHGSIKAAGKIEFKMNSVDEGDLHIEPAVAAEAVDLDFIADTEKNERLVSCEK